MDARSWGIWVDLAAQRSSVERSVAQQAATYYRAWSDAGTQYFIASTQYQDEETLRPLGAYVLPALAERDEPRCGPERSEL